MNPKKLSDCIENSDNRLVQQAQQIPNYAQQHRKKRLRSWTAVAACIALMVCSFCVGAFAFARETVVEVPIEPYIDTASEWCYYNCSDTVSE